MPYMPDLPAPGTVPTGIYAKSYMTLDAWDQAAWDKKVGEQFLKGQTIAPIYANPLNVAGFIKNVLLRQAQKQYLMKMQNQGAVCPPSSTHQSAAILSSLNFTLNNLIKIQKMIEENKPVREGQVPIIFVLKVCDDRLGGLTNLNLTSTDEAFKKSLDLDIRAISSFVSSARKTHQSQFEKMKAAHQKSKAELHKEHWAQIAEMTHQGKSPPQSTDWKPEQKMAPPALKDVFKPSKHYFYRSAIGWGTFFLSYKYFSDNKPFKKSGWFVRGFYALVVSTVAKRGYDAFSGDDK